MPQPRARRRSSCRRRSRARFVADTRRIRAVVARPEAAQARATVVADHPERDFPRGVIQEARTGVAVKVPALAGRLHDLTAGRHELQTSRTLAHRARLPGETSAPPTRA